MILLAYMIKLTVTDHYLNNLFEYPYQGCAMRSKKAIVWINMRFLCECYIDKYN